MSEFDFPVNITTAGLQPQSPTALLTQVQAAAAAESPGYTANLPGILIDDMSSTVVAGVAVSDSAKVDLVNSVNPNAANEALLGQLGTIYLGQSQPGLATNTSVLVVFSGTVGYVIANGLLVSDGTNTYQIQVGGVIGSGGTSASITAISIIAGSFAVAANTVTQIITSIPSGITLTVNNPNAGTPAGAAETWYAFRTRILQAGLAACVGTPRFIKTLLGIILGAQANLISVQQADGGLRIVVGGSADTYQVANAIFMAVADVSTLQGSAINSDRNVTVSLNDYPDTYNVLRVAAPVQTITMTITWNTTLSSFTGGAAFPALVQPPLVAYINGLAPGQVINVLEMNEIFQTAVESLLDSSFLTRLVFTVDINGTPTAPGSGTYAISGDVESSCSIVASGITVTQG